MATKNRRIKLLEQKMLKRQEIDYGQYVVVSPEEFDVLDTGDADCSLEIEQKYQLDVAPDRKVYTTEANPDVWD